MTLLAASGGMAMASSTAAQHWQHSGKLFAAVPGIAEDCLVLDQVCTQSNRTSAGH